MNLDRTGSPGERVCEALCGLRRAFCSQSARSRLRTGRAHVLVWGTPRNARLACDAQGDVVAARMVGIRQEGNPYRMVPSEKGRGARSANSCHDVTGKVRGCELPLWCVLKKKVEKSKPRHFEKTGFPGKGWKTPLLGHRNTLVRGMG